MTKPCEHARSWLIADKSTVLWCPECGAVNTDDGWKTPTRAAQVPLDEYEIVKIIDKHMKWYGDSYTGKLETARAICAKFSAPAKKIEWPEKVKPKFWEDVSNEGVAKLINDMREQCIAAYTKAQEKL